MANLAPEDIGPEDPIQPTIPLFNRISNTATITAMQLGYHAVVGIPRRIRPPLIHQPAQKKSYPCRPSLENRIFLPPRYNESKDLFPLYLDIHGGGFCLGEPADDDEFCSEFSQNFNIIVVSINYSKAPQNPYPGPVDDVAAIADAVINDSALRVDKNRVAIGGFSAGGALALAACQFPQLRGVIKACCPFYPVTDLSIPAEQKLKTRPWRDEDKGVDMLQKMGGLFNYSYINPGTRLKEPKLSPSYARKSDLPEWMFVVGAEFDMLCFEARVLACRLGELEIPNGREGMNDETGLKEKYGWERDDGKVRWLMARGLAHGFATSTKPPFAQDAEEERVRKEKFRAIWELVGEWLLKPQGPFAG